jgi:hypothetical protein
VIVSAELVDSPRSEGYRATSSAVEGVAPGAVGQGWRDRCRSVGGAIDAQCPHSRGGRFPTADLHNLDDTAAHSDAPTIGRVRRDERPYSRCFLQQPDPNGSVPRRRSDLDQRCKSRSWHRRHVHCEWTRVRHSSRSPRRNVHLHLPSRYEPFLLRRLMVDECWPFDEVDRQLRARRGLNTGAFRNRS